MTMMMNWCYFRRRRGARAQHEGSGHLYQLWTSPEGNYSSKSNKHSQYPGITDLSHFLWDLFHSGLSLAQRKHKERHTWYVNRRSLSCQQIHYTYRGFTFPKPSHAKFSRLAGHSPPSTPFPVQLSTPWSLTITGTLKNSLRTLQKTNRIFISKTNR